jgi:hypothetical protein
MSTARILNVKIVINPHSTNSFALRFEIEPKHSTLLKIIITSESKLPVILKEIRDQCFGKYKFELNFNWKNVPNSIKDNTKFQEELDQIFGNEITEIPQTLDFRLAANSVKKYIVSYGSAPDFADRLTEKSKKKIHNYIKSVIGMPRLIESDALKIADLVL